MTVYCNSLLWQYQMNQMAANYVSSLIFHSQGHLIFYPVLPFTQVLPNYPG